MMLSEKKRKEVNNSLSLARRLDKQGLLPADVRNVAKDIDSLDLITYKSNEEKSVAIARQVAAFMKRSGGKCPARSSRNIKEKQMAEWIQTMRKVKYGKRGGADYRRVNEILKDWPHVFRIRSHHKNIPSIVNGPKIECHKTFDIQCVRNPRPATIELAYNVYDWIKYHDGKYPKQSSNDKTERRYAQWINTQKRAKQGKGDSTFYPAIENIFKDLCPNIFEAHGINQEQKCVIPNSLITNHEQNAHETATKIYKWIKNNNNQYPKINSKDKTERRWAIWIANQKQAKQGKGANVYHKNVLKSVLLPEYPDILDSRRHQTDHIKNYNVHTKIKNKQTNVNELKKDIADIVVKLVEKIGLYLTQGTNNG